MHKKCKNNKHKRSECALSARSETVLLNCVYLSINFPRQEETFNAIGVDDAYLYVGFFTPMKTDNQIGPGGIHSVKNLLLAR